MAVVSIRFKDPRHHERLKEAARRAGTGMSPLAERLIEEGLRMADHPFITFRDGPAGRRPGVVGGPDVTEVLGAIIDNPLPPEERITWAAEMMNLTRAQVEAVIAYYAEFTDEVDADIADRDAFAERAYAQWRREQELLSR